VLLRISEATAISSEEAAELCSAELHKILFFLIFYDFFIGFDFCCRLFLPKELFLSDFYFTRRFWSSVKKNKKMLFFLLFLI